MTTTIPSGRVRLQSGKYFDIDSKHVVDRDGFPDDDWVYGSLSDADEAEIAQCTGARSTVSLSERFASIRAERGWSLRDVRDAVERATGHKIAFSYLRTIEHEGATSPSVATLVRIAAGYGMTAQELLAPCDLSPLA